MKQSKVFPVLSLLVLISMVLSACSAPTTVAQQPEVVRETQIIRETQIVEREVVVTATPAEVEVSGPNPELQQAMAGAYEGETVNIFGNYTAEDEARFNAALEPFRIATGIDVQFEGSADFAQLITVRVEGGDAPDIAEMSQPALMNQFGEEGKLVDLYTVLDKEQLAEDYAQTWLDFATTSDGKLNGIFYRANTKSIVWYPVAAFEEAGYEIPQTWDEMLALSDQIVESGSTPWCISIEHSSTTGWVGTDWVEDVILRMYGAEFYDQWMRHEVPFNAPEVKAAFEKVGEIWFNDQYVYGGTNYILTTWVGQTQDPMFEETGPECWMHRQAGWYSGFFPEGVVAGVDSDYFYLPPIDEQYGKPVLGAGDSLVMFNDRPEVRAVMQFLSTPEGGKVWALAGNFISPIRTFPLEWYYSDADRSQAEILQNADVFRFDASDLMPPEVGTGSFWKGVVDWVSGNKDLDTVLNEIEASWPTE